MRQNALKKRSFHMSQYSILVVDDQPSVCDQIRNLLKDKYAVQAFTSGTQAIKYMGANTADLALLDYDMPNMTGYETLMHLRSDKRHDEMPIIFVTAITNERMESEMMTRGASDYIRKPIKMIELQQCIEKHLTKTIQRGNVENA